MDTRLEQIQEQYQQMKLEQAMQQMSQQMRASQYDRAYAPPNMTNRPQVSNQYGQYGQQTAMPPGAPPRVTGGPGAPPIDPLAKLREDLQRRQAEAEIERLLQQTQQGHLLTQAQKLKLSGDQAKQDIWSKLFTPGRMDTIVQAQNIGSYGKPWMQDLLSAAKVYGGESMPWNRSIQLQNQMSTGLSTTNQNIDSKSQDYKTILNRGANTGTPQYRQG